MTNILDDNLNGLFERGMDYAAVRQQVIANNVANVNTPRFRRSDISFRQVMKSMSEQGEDAFTEDAIGMTNPRHFALNSNPGNRMAGFLTKPNATQIRNDGNNVDINVEMGEAAKNGLYQQAVSQLLARRFRLTKDIIKGR